MADLEKRLKQLDEEIILKKKSIEKKTQDNQALKVKATDLQARYVKEFGEDKKDQIIINNKCSSCFLSKSEKYKNINFEQFSDILHREISVYLGWLTNKLEAWKPKAETIIDEVVNTIKRAFPKSNPEVQVTLVGSYKTGHFVPWSNFNFNVVAYDSNGRKIPPEEMMTTLAEDFSQKLNILSQIKMYKGSTVTILKLECRKEYDSRRIEISLREDKYLLKTEEIITNYMKTYKFLQPLYFVLKKFLFNTKLCALSDPNSVELFDLGRTQLIHAYFDDSGTLSEYEIPT